MEPAKYDLTNGPLVNGADMGSVGSQIQTHFTVSAWVQVALTHRDGELQTRTGIWEEFVRGPVTTTGGKWGTVDALTYESADAVGGGICLQ